MSRPSGLGRGLSALIPAPSASENGLLMLPLSAIRPSPHQPRGAFDDGKLEELARSLRQVGMLQPILVRPRAETGYEIIAGERRFRAARLAGLLEVPAIVRHTGDTQVLTEAVVENIHRADLNPLEEAAAFRQLLDDLGMTHDELAGRLGKSRSSISNALRLLTLPSTLQQKVAEGVLSAGHARALLGAEPDDLQERLARRVVAEELSVRATEHLVRSAMESRRSSAAEQQARLAQEVKRRHEGPFRHLQHRLTDVLSTRVRITGTPKRGKLVIDYAGAEDLERLLSILGRGTGHDLLRDGD